MSHYTIVHTGSKQGLVQPFELVERRTEIFGAKNRKPRGQASLLWYVANRFWGAVSGLCRVIYVAFWLTSKYRYRSSLTGNSPKPVGSRRKMQGWRRWDGLGGMISSLQVHIGVWGPPSENLVFLIIKPYKTELTHGFLCLRDRLLIIKEQDVDSMLRFAYVWRRMWSCQRQRPSEAVYLP